MDEAGRLGTSGFGLGATASPRSRGGSALLRRILVSQYFVLYLTIVYFIAMAVFFPDLAEEPWRGVQYVAVSEMLEPMHQVDVTDQIEKAVASLSEHRRYLELLSDTPVEEQARQIVGMIAADEEGRHKVGFKLYWG